MPRDDRPYPWAMSGEDVPFDFQGPAAPGDLDCWLVGPETGRSGPFPDVGGLRWEWDTEPDHAAPGTAIVVISDIGIYNPSIQMGAITVPTGNDGPSNSDSGESSVTNHHILPMPETGGCYGQVEGPTNVRSIFQIAYSARGVIAGLNVRFRAWHLDGMGEIDDEVSVVESVEHGAFDGTLFEGSDEVVCELDPLTLTGMYYLTWEFDCEINNQIETVTAYDRIGVFDISPVEIEEF